VEGDCIIPLQDYEQAWKQENLGILVDDYDTPASFLDLLIGYIIPCACCSAVSMAMAMPTWSTW